MIKKDNFGFTIIELMIAITSFSLILIVATYAIIGIGRTYYKNITSSRTQEVSRQIIGDVSTNLQLTGGTPAYEEDASPDDPGNYGKLCIGNVRYAFWENNLITEGSNNKGLWKQSNITNCDDPNFDGGQELIAENMRLLNLDIGCQEENCAIKVRVAYGENDLLDIYETNGTRISSMPASAGSCRPSIGSSFCAVSELETYITKRVQ